MCIYIADSANIGHTYPHHAGQIRYRDIPAIINAAKMQEF